MWLYWRHNCVHHQDPRSAYLWDTLGSLWWRAIFKRLHMSTDGKVCVFVPVCVCVEWGVGGNMHMPLVTHMHQTCTKTEVRLWEQQSPLGRSFNFTNPCTAVIAA